ncbi:hypothetical protein J3458_021887 [Metarhizium acridum]|uniref:uncharacterized protein n=1 Tax=Metarhizium acridum TaxID=92637 RepID=UPI001C6A9D45|nr:hypothetical protein J3458_021887 [Metarhizium acridum]
MLTKLNTVLKALRIYSHQIDNATCGLGSTRTIRQPKRFDIDCGNKRRFHLDASVRKSLEALMETEALDDRDQKHGQRKGHFICQTASRLDK